MPMRRFVFAVAALLSAWFSTTPAQAEAYPDKPIKLVVPLVPGSPITALARVVAQPLAARLGQQIIIESRPGAGTSIGVKAASVLPPDGYNLLMYGQNIAYLQQLYPDLGFDPMQAFVPVAPLAAYFHVIVISPALPARTLQEFIAYAKANPGKLNFGIGLGTMPQIIGEYFNQEAGLDIVTIPYAGGEQVRVDLLGGRIHMNVGPPTNLMGLIKEGKLRPLAVTSKQRMKELPDVPTMIESGYPQVGFHPDVWQGILAPAGTPATIVEKLNGEINAVLQMAEVRTGLLRLGVADIMSMSAPEFAAFVAGEGKKWPPIIKAIGFKAQ
jgi:tripartite-type tricarboxylate transporter receptor subunit TctC